MVDMEVGKDETDRVIQHLEAALESEDIADTDYHVREALQLLRIQE